MSTEPVTVYVSIGNSDDKLTQREWSNFTCRVDGILRAYGHVHGYWHSLADSAWQNACWCVEFGRGSLSINPGGHAIMTTRAMLAELCGKYRKDSIAWAVAQTEFIAASPHAAEAPCFEKGHVHK